MGLQEAIQQLHDRCAIYTSSSTASRLLDMIGWTSDSNLAKSVLLEPCVGEGAILLEGARRLIASMRLYKHGLGKAALLSRIKGFELHPEAAQAAKANLRRLLLDAGIGPDTVHDLVEAWIRERDFLLEPPGKVTHVAANPPYLRWGKLPPLLATKYRSVLPASVTRGDLSVAFLHRMQEWGRNGGMMAVLVSDRWMYAQYGDEFVKATQARGWSINVEDERPVDPFVREVGAYSAIVILSKGNAVERETRPNSRTNVRTLLKELVAKHGTLADAKCKMRVGPALGAGRTFVVLPDQAIEVEAELVRSFVDKRDLRGEKVDKPLLRVIVPYAPDGKLIDPSDWPKFARWAEARREILAHRSQFRDSGQFWRTIDAVPEQWSVSPKLLLPELSNKPAATLDHTGSIPAHSIYAIWSDEWPIDVLQKVLNSGLLELTAKAEAPMLKSGWMRFYKRFVMRTPLPRWSSLRQMDQEGLSATGKVFDDTFNRLFDFKPGVLPAS